MGSSDLVEGSDGRSSLRIRFYSLVAQLVERLTVNEAATYGGKADVSRRAELTPQLVSRSETCGVN